LQSILQSQNAEIEDEQLLTPYDPPAPPDISDDEDSLLQPVDDNEVMSIQQKNPGRGLPDGYICKICFRPFKYKKSFRNHMKIHPIPQRSLLKPRPAPSSKQQAPYDSRSPYEIPALYSVPKVRDSSESKDSTDSQAIPTIGERHGDFVCNYCLKSFKYFKAYDKHQKLHLKATPGIRKKLMRAIRRRPKFMDTGASPEQPESPDQDEIMSDDEPIYDRDSSPDLGEFVTENFLNCDDPPEEKPRASSYNKLPYKPRSPKRKRQRGRPKNPQGQVKIEPNKGGLEPPAPSRGPGRPKKHLSNAPNSANSSAGSKSEIPDEAFALLEGFTEVDLSKVLKSKSTFEDNSVSNPGTSTSHSRSRSSSVEIVQEFDVFGSPKFAGPSARTNFPCNHSGCDKKFHLRANLKKHHRDDHGLT
jgi:C2H2-type zinc finger